MAWTVAFALLGALVFALLIAPVLCSFLFSSEMKEWRNPVLEWLNRNYARTLDWCFDHLKLTLGIGLLGLALMLFIAFSGCLLYTSVKPGDELVTNALEFSSEVAEKKAD